MSETAEATILRKYRTVAVVGASADESRASYEVACYLKEHGYRIIPVNPREKEVLGERCYPDLCSLPEPVEVVMDRCMMKEHKKLHGGQP